MLVEHDVLFCFFLHKGSEDLAVTLNTQGLTELTLCRQCLASLQVVYCVWYAAVLKLVVSQISG